MPDQGEFAIQGFNLVKLLKRLEDATARLEDVTIYQEGYIQSKIEERNQADKKLTNEDTASVANSGSGDITTNEVKDTKKQEDEKSNSNNFEIKEIK